ncbi:MAG: double-strand break repair protein AddB [Alphaproteobacteria bacterium]|nr:double-strand break repair protein AddB [Alphaproteobacteria bacterium]MDE2110907.1 double-strand break repair protein AddB [Alphaproteobacteria bacterium]MDE2495390.1 double-strand break repair protein AddB [Alphaproteobacteria bacterium]
MPRSPDSAQRAKVFAIPAGAPFSATLTQGLLQRFGSDVLALADITIYLPTRRAARSIAEIFAKKATGATLLPDFRPLGDVDEDELLLDASDDFGLKPAITPLRRRLLLAALIHRWSCSRDGGALAFGQAAGLAKSLAAVIDDIETQGADLEKLANLAPLSLAEHWSDVKEFLALIQTQWPALLEAEGCVNPATHRNESLRALAKRLQDAAPDRPIIAAGSTGSIPATADLLGVIARLPKGAVVLPGLDRSLDDESWDRIDPGHPQFALKQLLQRIGVVRAEVADWTDADGLPVREQILREVLRPAPTTDAWRVLAERGGAKLVAGLEGLTLMKAAYPAEEASIVALLLREVLETPTCTAALITRDRALARRVTAELQRWDIAIDDSAGRPLTQTAAGSYLCLIAEAADSGFAPVPLLALLKHPLATMGEAVGIFRSHARKLDMLLRGPRPNSGLAGIAAAIAGADGEFRSWFARVMAALAPIETALSAPEVTIRDALTAHIATAEHLADRLWQGVSGDAGGAFVAALLDASADLPLIEARSYAPLFRALAEEQAVRPPYGRHPRLSILGPLEARLQHFDLVVLGGLNEGSWPASASNDPWFSRPMRQAMGLEQPERAIGLSAHDFATLAAGPRVVLTRALKAEGAPTVASRWIQRLEQLTRGLNIDGALAATADYARIAAALADPGKPDPIKPPAPRPPVEARPRKLSVTEIETWVRDPYAIYAKRVLNLRPLDPLDGEIGPMERGTTLHRVLELFAREYPKELPADAAMRLVEITDQVFRELAIPKATLALWRPRFLNAANWFVGEERGRRAGIAEIFAEVKGEHIMKGPAGDFTLYGRADRIDRLKTGGGAILDYKTGAPPSDSQVLKHLAPQLALEGAMLAAGGFKDIGPLTPEELVYVRVTGAAEPGFFRAVKTDAATIAKDALERLVRRIVLFDDPATPYDSRVAPYRADVPGDYDHLARVREWSASGWRGERE